jgi:hypothetical protein
MALGINRKDRDPIFKEDGGGMAKVLARLPVHHDLTVGLSRKIHRRNPEGRFLGGGG